MKNSKRLITYWGWFHIGFIMLVCCYSTYHKYCRFYKAKENTLIKSVDHALFSTKTVSYYGRLTGTGAGYGFFAPQIKSTGVIIGDCDGKKITANLKNFESMMRFGMMASRVTDYITSSEDSHQFSDSTLEVKYYDLVFKSIAVKIYNQNHCRQDTLYMSYNMVTFPTLAAYRQGQHDYNLQQIKEVRIIKQAQ